MTPSENDSLRLDTTKLQKLKQRGENFVARCPACAESGGDEKGDHLFMAKNGRFGCVQFPGPSGTLHRKRIFELVGFNPGKDKKSRRRIKGWSTLEEAIAAFEPRLGTAVRRDAYKDGGGNSYFVVVRFERSGAKEYRPFHNDGSQWIAKDPAGPLPLFNLPELVSRQNESVVVVEGEKCATDLAAIGALSTTSAHGAKSAHKTDWTPLAGRSVVILPDNDAEGLIYAQNVAAILKQPCPPASVRIVNLPGLPLAGDCVDWLEARDAQTPEDHLAELNSLIAGSAEQITPQIDGSDMSAKLNCPRPKVELPSDGRLLSNFAIELADIMKSHGVYERGGLAFIVNQQGDGLEVITAQRLRTLVEHHLICFRVKRNGEMAFMLDRTMTESDAQGVLCSQQFLSRLPKVQKIATARLPVVRSDGRIELLPAGYDTESFTLTIPQCDYDDSMPLDRAKAVIGDLLSEFCFADSIRSKGVAVAAMVGLFGIGLLPKGALRPVFIYLANAEGAGKTMLAKCAISPVHGFVETEGAPKDKTELAKELLTAVIEARPYTLLDNCKGHLDSAQLEAFVTSVRWKGRVLGVSKSFCGENNVTVFVTGNSCTVSPDIRRRSLFIELFMEQERAEDRNFRRVLDDAALLEMRSEILAALWALVRKWDVAGRSKPSRTHSSFPRWAEIFGGIVESAGYGCPLTTAEIQAATDVDGNDMCELVRTLNGEPLKFDELVETARERGLFERIVGGEGDLKPSDKSSLGKLLKRYDRRIFRGGKRFIVDGKGHSRRFRVGSESEST